MLFWFETKDWIRENEKGVEKIRLRKARLILLYWIIFSTISIASTITTHHNKPRWCNGSMSRWYEELPTDSQPISLPQKSWAGRPQRCRGLPLWRSEFDSQPRQFLGFFLDSFPRFCFRCLKDNILFAAYYPVSPRGRAQLFHQNERKYGVSSLKERFICVWMSLMCKALLIRAALVQMAIPWDRSIEEVFIGWKKHSYIPPFGTLPTSFQRDRGPKLVIARFYFFSSYASALRFMKIHMVNNKFSCSSEILL